MAETERQLIVGRQPVREALRAERPLERVVVSTASRPQAVADIIDLARRRGVPVERQAAPQIDRMAAGQRHQGVAAWAAPLAYADLETALQRAAAAAEPPFLLLLDGVQDPRNLGALLRTAEAAGVHGVVVPERRASGITPVVLKAAAGAAERVPVVRIKNLVRTMEALKSAGLWIAGAAAGCGQTFWEADLTGPVAIVIGAEGKGLSRLVRERCDYLLEIPMRGRLESLNASVAGALLLYEVFRRRRVTADS